MRCNHDWSPDPLPTVPRPLTRLAYAHFASGPPGGRTLPLSPSRLSDSFGGIYGPHASWASTGANAHRAAVKASSAVARGETEKEVLEYYQYHSDRDTHLYTVRLGRLFYLGSIYFHPGGISSGAEQVGEIPQSFAKAKEYFLRVARTLWPVDFEGGDASKVAGKRKMSKEMEESVREPAMVARRKTDREEPAHHGREGVEREIACRLSASPR